MVEQTQSDGSVHTPIHNRDKDIYQEMAYTTDGEEDYYEIDKSDHQYDTYFEKQVITFPIRFDDD